MPQLEKIDWKPVESTNVDAAYWHDPSQTICVRFKSGGLYTYIGLSEGQYRDFIYAPSVGRHLNRVLKAFPTTRWQSEDELLAHLNV
jgi:KTSC domain